MRTMTKSIEKYKINLENFREVKIAHVNIHLPSLKNLQKHAFQFALEGCFL